MNEHTIQLIDGDFSHNKAKSLLIELLNYKIKFHGIEKFSNEIRFGEDLEHSEKRIKQLTNEKQNLMQWLNDINATDKIKINCTIKIEIIN